MAGMEHRYEVEVKTIEEKQKMPEDVKEVLKSAGMIDEKGKIKINGVSSKMLKRMRQEYVECPVLESDVHFIKCFVCPNFQSRVTGMVLCKGAEI